MNRFFKLIFLIFIASFIFLNSKLLKDSSKCLVDQKNDTVIQGVTPKSPHKLCEGTKMNSCIPPLMKFKQLYRFSKKHTLAACVIEKTFSTFLTAIMCYLHDSKNFIAKNRTLDTDIYGKRLCQNTNEANELKKIPDHQKMKLFTVVRNPFDRFVSGFTDKCLREKVWQKYKHRCGGCKTNITCFVDHMYERMKKFAKAPYKGIEFDDSHFFPQSWRCEFSTMLSRYEILKLDDDDFINKLLEFFRDVQVSDEGLHFINENLHRRTPHSTLDSVERELVESTIKNSTYLTRRIIQMYYFDFLLFGYHLPELPIVPLD